MEGGLDYVDSSSYGVRTPGGKNLGKFKTFKAARAFSLKYLANPTTRVKSLEITDDGSSWGSIATVASISLHRVIAGKDIGPNMETADDSIIHPLDSAGNIGSVIYVYGSKHTCPARWRKR